jgi:DNA gyrase subunit A
MEREKILEELREVMAEIARLKLILSDHKVMLDLIVAELEEIKLRYGDDRRTEIIEDQGEINIEDLIADEEMVVTISRTGYIKRTPITLYRSKRRGGRGKMGMTTRDEDLVTSLFVASTHDTLLVFSNFGKVYKLKVWQIPESGRNAKGRPIVNMIPVDKDEVPKAVLALRELKEGYSILTVTRGGQVKRTKETDYTNIRSSGIIGVVIEENDDLIAVNEVRDDEEILLVTKDGQSIRFQATDVRDMGRGTKGVMGIRVREGDEVVGGIVLKAGETILTVSENGFGKRSEPDEYRIQHRGGTGIITIKTSERNGRVVSAIQVSADDNIMLVTDGGKVIRTRVKEIPVLGRNTQGVKLINLDAGERVTGVERLAEEDEEPEGVAADADAEGDDSFRFHSKPPEDEEIS